MKKLQPVTQREIDAARATDDDGERYAALIALYYRASMNDQEEQINALAALIEEEE